MTGVLKTLLAAPNIASKRWVYEQYDSMVRTNNVVLAGADAAVVLIKESNKALALKTDCNGRYVYLNPRLGGMIAVAEAARNVVCTGATPVAITNCLNFGNPYKPEVYWQFKEAVEGMGEACRAFDTPVTGGNVSFYNESPTASVFPTPVIGMLGVVDDLNHIATSHFKTAGDRIVLLGMTSGHVGGSEYLSLVHGLTAGDAPPLDLGAELRLQRATLKAIAEGLVQSAHDCSEGGLAVALAECCFSPDATGLGATVEHMPPGLREDFLLYGEDQSRILISAREESLGRLLDVCREHGVAATLIGSVTADGRLKINRSVDAGVGELSRIYLTAIEALVGG
jgi:phosphoribosylformylglycinamidine synthase